MAYVQKNFLPLSAMGNSDAPRHWTYTTTDSKSTTVASGYFDNAYTLLEVNDLIWVVGATGGTQVFTLVLVDAITDGVVTVVSSEITLS